VNNQETCLGQLQVGCLDRIRIGAQPPGQVRLCCLATVARSHEQIEIHFDREATQGGHQLGNENVRNQSIGQEQFAAFIYLHGVWCQASPSLAKRFG